jgi:hypothetical protein
MYFEGWMSFTPWFKVVRDTDMDLLRPTGELHTAARAQSFGLFHLVKSKDATVKCSRSFFISWRGFYLNMVYSNNRWGSFKHTFSLNFFSPAETGRSRPHDTAQAVTGECPVHDLAQHCSTE